MSEQTVAEVPAGETKVAPAVSNGVEKAKQEGVAAQPGHREWTRRRVSVSSLVASPLRSEPEESKLEELAEAMWDEHDPILAYEDKDGILMMADGARRKKMAEFKGIKRVEVINLGRISEAEALTLILRSGVTGKPRPPLETARLIERLMKENPALDSQGKAAAHLGVSKMFVSRHLKLLKAPAEEQAAVHAGEKSMTSVVRTQDAGPAEPKTVAVHVEDVPGEDRVLSILAPKPFVAVPPAGPDIIEPSDMFAEMGEVSEAKDLLDGVLSLATKTNAAGKRQILVKMREVAEAIKATFGVEGVAHGA